VADLPVSTSVRQCPFKAYPVTGGITFTSLEGKARSDERLHDFKGEMPAFNDD
jgi:hypothetical protein